MWSDKESFISWLHDEKEKNYQTLAKKLQELNYENINREHLYNNIAEIYSLENHRGGSEWAILCYSQVYKVEEYEFMITNEIVNYIDSNYEPNSDLRFIENPKLWEYEEFLICAYHIKIFEKTKLSKIKKEYNREVKQLQKRADEVAKYSFEPITIIIPRRTQDILSYLKFKLISSNSLKDFLFFFNYSTKNITIKTYLEFSKNNIKNIKTVRTLLNLEEPTSIIYVANTLRKTTIINTIQLSKIFNNQINPFFIAYKAHNIMT